MENNKIKFKQLPKGIKFATFNPKSEDVIFSEYLFASSIYTGASFNQLLEATNKIENEKEKQKTKTDITNLILAFIILNPGFAEVLKQNDKDHET